LFWLHDFQGLNKLDFTFEFFNCLDRYHW